MQEPGATGAEIDIERLILDLEAIFGKARLLARFDPMEELISCILSQHTSDKNSFPAFTRLRETYPEWGQVVNADPMELAQTIKSAGLSNQKSKSIIRCLAAIKERIGDYSLEHLRNVPTLEARSWLKELPGVGPKTASLVLCFSFGRETIPVDTHVFRVVRRLGLITEEINESKAHDSLLELVPGSLAFRFHAALIQHGRNICLAPVPVCSQCPISDRCAWFKTESQNL